MKRVIAATTACLYVAATIAFFMAAIWLSDARWGLTGFVLVVASVVIMPTLLVFMSEED